MRRDAAEQVVRALDAQGQRAAVQQGARGYVIHAQARVARRRRQRVGVLAAQQLGDVQAQRAQAGALVARRVAPAGMGDHQIDGTARYGGGRVHGRIRKREQRRSSKRRARAQPAAAPVAPFGAQVGRQRHAQRYPRIQQAVHQHRAQAFAGRHAGGQRGGEQGLDHAQPARNVGQQRGDAAEQQDGQDFRIRRAALQQDVDDAAHDGPRHAGQAHLPQRGRQVGQHPAVAAQGMSAPPRVPAQVQVGQRAGQQRRAHGAQQAGAQVPAGGRGHLAGQ